MTTDQTYPLAVIQPPFADRLGILSAQPDRLVAEMLVAPILMNHNGTLHGGAMMEMADHL